MSIYIPGNVSEHPSRFLEGNTDPEVGLYLCSSREFYQAAFHSVCEKGTGCSLQGVSDRLPESLGLDFFTNLHLIIIDIDLLKENWPISLEHVMDMIHQRLRLLLLIDVSDIEYVGQALKLGVSGYLLSSASLLECRLALYAVSTGSLWLKQDFIHTHLQPLSQNTGPLKAETQKMPLSSRELQILHRIAQGLTHKEIAHQLVLSEGSVRTYWNRVLNKLGAVNKAEAVARAASRGLLEYPQNNTMHSPHSYV